MGDGERYTAVISESVFFLFLCAALHNDGVGKILPYYPITVRTSEAAAFIFRRLVSCTIFPPFWEMLLRDAALPSGGEATDRVGHDKGSTSPASFL